MREREKSEIQTFIFLELNTGLDVISVHKYINLDVKNCRLTSLCGCCWAGKI